MSCVGRPIKLCPSSACLVIEVALLCVPCLCRVQRGSPSAVGAVGCGLWPVCARSSLAKILADLRWPWVRRAGLGWPVRKWRMGRRRPESSLKCHTLFHAAPVAGLSRCLVAAGRIKTARLLIARTLTPRMTLLISRALPCPWLDRVTTAPSPSMSAG